MKTENELVIEKIFEAPKELVWKAWTEPAYFMRWWGPKNFTCPICKIDLRVGGKHFTCMRSSEGSDYYSAGIYLEIVPMEKIIYTDSFADENGKIVPASHYGMPGDDWPLEMEVTIILDEHERKTKMTLRHKGLPAGEMKEMTSDGWNQSFDKLAESLENA